MRESVIEGLLNDTLVGAPDTKYVVGSYREDNMYIPIWLDIENWSLSINDLYTIDIKIEGLLYSDLPKYVATPEMIQRWIKYYEGVGAIAFDSGFIILFDRFDSQEAHYYNFVDLDSPYEKVFYNAFEEDYKGERKSIEHWARHNVCRANRYKDKYIRTVAHLNLHNNGYTKSPIYGGIRRIGGIAVNGEAKTIELDIRSWFLSYDVQINNSNKSLTTSILGVEYPDLPKMPVSPRTCIAIAMVRGGSGAIMFDGGFIVICVDKGEAHYYSYMDLSNPYKRVKCALVSDGNTVIPKNISNTKEHEEKMRTKYDDTKLEIKTGLILR